MRGDGRSSSARCGVTWWSEHNAASHFVLAKSTIRCRRVDRFVGSSVPSHVSGQRFSARGASLPSAGSRRARFVVFIGNTKALRLPARKPAQQRGEAAGGAQGGCLKRKGGGLPTVQQGMFSAVGGELKVEPDFSMAQATLRRRSATDRKARPWLWPRLRRVAYFDRLLGSR
jgi:hypothetical protein